MSVAMDTLKASQTLQAKGFDREQADAVAEMFNARIQEDVRPKLATAEQLASVVTRLDATIEKAFSQIDGKLSQLGAKMTRNMFAMLMGFAALIVTLNKLL